MRAVLAAVEEANAYIKEHRREAAAIYLKAEKSSMSVDFVEQMLIDLPDGFGTAPLRIMQHAAFMARLGMLRQMPKDWREMFLPLIAERGGS
jgi:NitT/TauT family transport system substrate-binding protein